MSLSASLTANTRNRPTAALMLGSRVVVQRCRVKGRCSEVEMVDGCGGRGVEFRGSLFLGRDGRGVVCRRLLLLGRDSRGLCAEGRCSWVEMVVGFGSRELVCRRSMFLG